MLCVGAVSVPAAARADSPDEFPDDFTEDQDAQYAETDGDDGETDGETDGEPDADDSEPIKGPGRDGALPPTFGTDGDEGCSVGARPHGAVWALGLPLLLLGATRRRR